MQITFFTNCVFYFIILNFCLCVFLIDLFGKYEDGHYTNNFSIVTMHFEGYKSQYYNRHLLVTNIVIILSLKQGNSILIVKEHLIRTFSLIYRQFFFCVCCFLAQYILVLFVTKTNSSFVTYSRVLQPLCYAIFVCHFKVKDVL